MKGFFSRARLSVAAQYVYPARQRRPYVLGAIVALPLVALFVINAVAGRGQLVSNGPLSTNHALFGGDCSTCHAPFGAVTNARCESCHEKVGDPAGIYSFKTHYRYRSSDFDRSAPSSKEGACFTCHVEHTGRAQTLTAVGNDRCASCHFGSFDAHPEFQFAAERVADPANLYFSHTVHVKEIRADSGFDDIERVCLSCHVPQPDGATFRPISFDADCGACHLTSRTATPALPVLSGPSDNRPGVLSLEAIRARGGPGTRWAFYANPNEFQRLGPNIRKRPLYHADPWIMENLRFLRDRLYPTAELADLLRASADVPPKRVRGLYEEAIGTLNDRIAELRDEPDRDVQTELARLQELLATVKARLDDPYTPLDETRFDVSVSDESSAIGPSEREAYDRVIDDLTKPCQECHFVEQATIQAVQADQRTLVRAEFDHRAHVLHARCLDCHNQIPIREFAARDEKAPPEVDHAGIENLPPIATCRSCHAPHKAADRCVTCHVFHPDKERWSDLLRYQR